MKKKTLIKTIAVILILAVLGPIIVTKIMKKVPGSGRMSKTALNRKIKRQILIEVSGKAAFTEDGTLVLTSDSMKKYVITGKDARELEQRVKSGLDKRITVKGKIKQPKRKEIGGEEIRFDIFLSVYTVEQ